MTNQSTIDKLIEMHMTPMADAFRVQKDDPSMKEVPFEDRFGMLVDTEYTARKNNRLKRLIRKAEFEQPDASIADIDYGHNRKLNRTLIERLATCEYITEYRNIFITGATGSGKTYMACAFGMEACKHYYTVKYVRMPDLLIDLKSAKDAGRFTDVLKKYTNPTLLILDEWLLLKLSEDDAPNLLELIHKRRKHSSTIFCSQFREEGWYNKLGGKDSPLSDAIMDRISYDSYKIVIESINPDKDISMRQRHLHERSLRPGSQACSVTAKVVIIAGTVLRDCAGGSAAHERSYASHSAGLLLPGLPDRRLRRTGIFIQSLDRKESTLHPAQGSC